MSKTEHPTSQESTPQHGTIRSYIIGFLLSVVFTLIPYYLVVYKSLEGSALLATIIGFAMLQLVVQVVFFLHLGREKKPRYNLIFLLSTISLIFVVVVGSIWIMNHLHYNMSATDVADKVSTDEAVYKVEGKQVGTCSGEASENHRIELKNKTAVPRHVYARLCDTITIINLDEASRTINFGPREDPGTYAGEPGKVIYPRRNMIFTLTELGAHQFHDSALNEVYGDFTVTP